MQIKAGATDQTIYVFIADSSVNTGAGLTGLAYNTASLVAYYVNNRGSATQITLATLAAANSAHADGGFKEVDATNMPGVYRLDLPDAAVASGNQCIVILKGAANMVPTAKQIDIVAFDPQDAAGLGLSRLDAAITTRLAPTTAGRTLDISTGGEAGIDWANIGSPTTMVNLSGTTVKTSTDIATLIGSPAGASIAADIATKLPTSSYTAPDNAGITAIKAKTDNLPASPAATGDIPSAATIAGAVWDEAYAGHLTSGTFGNVVANLPDAATTAYEVWQADPAGWSAAADTFGKLIIDAETDAGLIKVVTDKLDDTLELDTSVYRFTTNALEQAPTGGGGGLDAAGVRAAIGLASANLDTQLGAIDTVVDAILVDTAEIGAAGAGLTALASAANLSTLASYVDTEVAAIKAKTDNLPSDPADQSIIIAATDAILTAVNAVPTAAENGTAVRSELATELGRIDAAITTRMATFTYTAPLDAAGTRSALGMASANLDTQLSTIDTVVDAVKLKTDGLTYTVSGLVDVNIQSVNDAAITGNGQSGTEWGPA